MVSRWSRLKSVVTRLLFVVHVVVSVGLVVIHTKQPLYWWFLSGIVLMILELVYVLKKRKGQEYTSFWPSCFLYLGVLIPVIWVIEIDYFQNRQNELDYLAHVFENNNTDFTVAGVDLKVFLNDKLLAKKVCEIGVVIVIIVGRWFQPRGNLTRNQLSKLLLIYTVSGADILELFSALTDGDTAKIDIQITYVTLVAFTWSMLQFCFVFADDPVLRRSTIRHIHNRVHVMESNLGGVNNNEGMDVDMDDTISTIDANMGDQSGKTPWGDTQTPTDNESTDDATDTKPCCCRCNSEFVHDIIIPLVMQDGPFLVLRLVLSIMFGVVSENHIFFTFKNAATVAVLFYRLIIIASG